MFPRRNRQSGPQDITELPAGKFTTEQILSHFADSTVERYARQLADWQVQDAARLAEHAEIARGYAIAPGHGERHRQEVQHLMLALAGRTMADPSRLDGDRLHHPLHAAPFGSRDDLFRLLNQPPRILDVGCGSGAWLRDMGATYGGSELFGYDLFSAQDYAIPPERSVPNAHLSNGDLFTGLGLLSMPVTTNQENRPADVGRDGFDLVLMRDMQWAIPAGRWGDVIIQLAIRSRGWVELEEPSLPVSCGPVVEQICGFIVALAKELRRDVFIAIPDHSGPQPRGLLALLRGYGAMTDARIIRLPLPFSGPNPPRIATAVRVAFAGWVRALAPAFERAGIIERHQLEGLLRLVVQQPWTGSSGEWPWYYAFGRSPNYTTELEKRRITPQPPVRGARPYSPSWNNPQERR